MSNEKRLLETTESSETVTNQASETSLPNEVIGLRSEVAPKQWGGFELIQSLGVGGLAEVFLVMHRHSRQPQALKICRDPSPMAIDRMKREFRILRSISGNRIPQSYHLRQHDEHWGFTLRYCQGSSPLTYCRGFRGPCDFVRTASILRQMAVSLARLHRLGITHGDVKPDNVIVDAREHAWFVDFGLACRDSLADQLAHPQGTSGTFQFLAPEVVLHGCYGTPADVFALGRTAFQLLAGKFPSADPHQCAEQEQYLQRLREQLPPDAPIHLTNLVLNMLRCQPSERPSAQEIAKCLGATDRSFRDHPTIESSLIPTLRCAAQTAARRQLVTLKLTEPCPVHSIQTALAGAIREVPWILSQEVDCRREHLPLRAFDAILGTIVSWAKRLPEGLGQLVPWQGNPVVQLLEGRQVSGSAEELVDGAHRLIRSMSRNRLLVIPIRNLSAADPLSQRLYRRLARHPLGKRILFLLLET